MLKMNLRSEGIVSPDLHFRLARIPAIDWLLGASRKRRFAKEFEACTANAEEWIFVAAVRIFLRWLAAIQQPTPEL